MSTMPKPRTLKGGGGGSNKLQIPTSPRPARCYHPDHPQGCSCHDGPGIPPKKQPPRPKRLVDVPQKTRTLVSLDTETTGVDLWHGCKPFFVSGYNPDKDELFYWEWDVNPLTRNVGFYVQDSKGKPQVQKDGENSPYGKKDFVPKLRQADFADLQKLVGSHDFVFHNTKFDVRGLQTHGLPEPNWENVHDTLIASHTLCSNEPHGLKELALQYLDINDDDQQELKQATNEARRIARNLGWAIASDERHPHFPAQQQPKDGWWVLDTWLPRAVARYKWEVEGDEEFRPSHSDPANYAGTLELRAEEGHRWWTVLKRYALRDAERTYGIWLMQKEQLEKEGLYQQYDTRRRLLKPIYDMEANGATLSNKRLATLQKRFSTEAKKLHDRCMVLAEHKLDNLNSSRQLQGILYSNMGITPSKQTKTGYSTDAETLRKLLDRTEGDAHEFIKCLIGYRKREKMQDYLEEYCMRSTSRYMDDTPLPKGYSLLHFLFNPTGTDTTRFSSSQPNAQNIGKQEIKNPDGKVDDYNIRRVFGPAPGREWYSIDYSNIELRLFAWESGDENLINAFKEGYSVHLIFAELLYKEQWAECVRDFKRLSKGVISPKETQRGAGELFKLRYENGSYYQWVKNGNFALIYGAGREKADATYHMPGAYDLIRKRMPRIDDLIESKSHEARARGYITTHGGYRLYVPYGEPHKALNYYIQGSAGWFMCEAILNVYAYLSDVNKVNGLTPTEGYKMIMTIHDELDFDFPLLPPESKPNTQTIKDCGRLMSNVADRYGVPVPCTIEHHPDNWAVGEKVK